MLVTQNMNIFIVRYKVEFIYFRWVRIYQIKFKYWACGIRLINTETSFWIQYENMGTMDTHLGLSKSPTGAKRRPKCSPESLGSSRVPRGRG